MKQSSRLKGPVVSRKVDNLNRTSAVKRDLGWKAKLFIYQSVHEATISRVFLCSAVGLYRRDAEAPVKNWEQFERLNTFPAGRPWSSWLTCCCHGYMDLLLFKQMSVVLSSFSMRWANTALASELRSLFKVRPSLCLRWTMQPQLSPNLVMPAVPLLS